VKNLDSLRFREIDPTHYAEAYAFNLLHELSFREASGDDAPDSESERVKNTANILIKLTNGERKYYCLAVFEGENMIAIHFLNRQELDRQPACHIHGLFVHPEYRGIGIATRLKAMGEEWARAMGCAFMDSHVRTTNERMLAINEKLGYTIARYNLRKSL
jgi:ribosomal protein S18 acetylase RimI-like enzyme